jgi:hypothetical protein
MTDFSLTTLFVVPDGTLAAAGSTDALTSGQLGVFLPDYTIATGGTIATAKYFYIAQGRPSGEITSGSKRSDKIDKLKIQEWYKVLAEPDATTQIVDVSNFSVKCGEDITLTIRAHSNYIEALFFNGLQVSVTVPTACCACGADPCTVLDPQATVDAIIAKLNLVGSLGGGSNIRLTDLFTFTRVGTGASSVLRIVAKPLTVYGQPCDLRAFPYEYDRMWFRTFVTRQPDTSADSFVPDTCTPVATVTVVARSTYVKGHADEIRMLERRYYAYQAGAFKQLYDKVGYNGNFTSFVVDGKFYDTYYIRYIPYDFYQETDWQDAIRQNSTVIVAFEAGEGAAFEALIVAALGAVSDKTGVNVTTTTTTTTTTTSTSTTTTLIP